METKEAWSSAWHLGTGFPSARGCAGLGWHRGELGEPPHLVQAAFLSWVTSGHPLVSEAFTLQRLLGPGSSLGAQLP